MKILILEDEPLVAVSLINLVRELEPSAVLDGPLGSVKEATEWLNKNILPDLILSDIQLSDGISLDIFRVTNHPVLSSLLRHTMNMRSVLLK